MDDEPNVLEGISLHLSRRYDLTTATSGAKALELVESGPPFAVILSDMRMPGMDGAAFLGRARSLAPNAVRMLLTGQTDLDSAISAVNEGQIFRFLTKPCSPQTLLSAVEAAANQHRLLTAERVLLEQTLHGSIRALVDVLSLTSPASFGRSTRIKQLAGELGAKLGLEPRWPVEMAAMVSQLGCIALPAETVERLYHGQPLSPEEREMVARVPALTEQLLAHIPRLEVVREILATYEKPYRAAPPDASPEKRYSLRCAQVLKVAVDLDSLEAQGETAAFALDTLRGRMDRYDPEVVAALVAVRGGAEARRDVREVPTTGLRVGMVLAEDVKTAAGTLLFSRGHEVTPGFIERVRNFRPGTLKPTLRVIVRPTNE
ncbi:MAG TPA: HD domain-containing phosphohydrolase [Polyangiaceae bacterium]|nr:HD domain-containing phosphohydrolase [Polyangiaceae bacterium]